MEMAAGKAGRIRQLQSRRALLQPVRPSGAAVPVRSEPARALAAVACRGAGADRAGDSVHEWAAGEYAGAGVSLSPSFSRQASVIVAV